MKPLTALAHLLLLATCSASFAQNADKLLTAHARDSRVKLESSVKDYLVVFNSHQDLDRARVGIPLASFADGAVNIAYDLSGRNVMAQWTFAQLGERTLPVSDEGRHEAQEFLRWAAADPTACSLPATWDNEFFRKHFLGSH